MKHPKAFTLIELLVVIAVITVLMGILMYLSGNPDLSFSPDPAESSYSYHSSHSFHGAMHNKPYFSLKQQNADFSALPTAMNGLKLNAGYLDGHVAKFSATETVHFTHNNLAHNWLTPKYR